MPSIFLRRSLGCLARRVCVCTAVGLVALSPVGAKAAQSVLAAAPAAQAGSDAKATATVSGSVVDSTGAAIPTAKIVLNDGAENVAGMVHADERGGFVLAGLAAGEYRITVEAPGFQSLVAPTFRLATGQVHDAGQLEMALAGNRADVEVNVTEHALAAEQLTAALHQRALGIFPNFYSSYIWDAAPMSLGQKMHLAFRSVLDPVSFATTGVVAGVEQAHNTYPAYGGGVEGYGKRYGAAFAGHVTSRVVGSALLPSLFHQDPRYFYLGPGHSFRTRFGYALTRSVVARGDNGHWQPAYATVLGAFASGAIAYSYHPAGDRGASLLFRDGTVQIGARALTNLIREFVLRSVSTNIPEYEKGAPPPLPKGKEVTSAP